MRLLVLSSLGLVAALGLSCAKGAVLDEVGGAGGSGSGGSTVQGSATTTGANTTVASAGTTATGAGGASTSVSVSGSGGASTAGAGGAGGVAAGSSTVSSTSAASTSAASTSAASTTSASTTSASSSTASSTSASSSGTGGGGGGGPLGCVAVEFPFTSCPSGWTSSGPNNDWQCGSPSGGSGPPGDHTSGNGPLWATNVAGTTNNCEDSKLVSPPIDLSAFAGKAVLLRMWHWYDFRGCTPNGFLCPAFACTLDTTSYSGGIIEVLSGGVWTQINPVGGYGNGGQQISCSYPDAACMSCSLEGKVGFSAAGAENTWSQATFDISAYVSAAFQVRFGYASHDAYTCYPKTGGWYIDDVEIGTEAACSP